MDDIYTLWNKVREHPDFRFGVIFTSNDLMIEGGESLTDLLSDDDCESIETAMIEVATEVAYDVTSLYYRDAEGA